MKKAATLWIGLVGTIGVLCAGCEGDTISYRDTLVAEDPYLEDRLIPVRNVTAETSDATAHVFWDTHPSAAVSGYTVSRILHVNQSTTTVAATPGLGPLSVRRGITRGGVPIRWVDTTDTRFSEALVVVGNYEYQVQAIFPDTTLSIASATVTVHIAGSNSITNGTSTPPGGPPETGSSQEPCLTIEDLRMLLPEDTVCFDMLYYNDPGDDEDWSTSLDQTPFRREWFVASGVTGYVPPIPMPVVQHDFGNRFPYRGDHVLELVMANAGANGIWGDPDDRWFQLYDGNILPRQNTAIAASYQFSGKSTTCVRIKGDLAQYQHLTMPTGISEVALEYDWPGADGLWLTADDSQSGWNQRLLDPDGLVTDITWRTLPGNDLKFLTSDDYTGARASMYRNASGAVTTTRFFGFPGSDSVFGTDDDFDLVQYRYTYDSERLAYIDMLERAPDLVTYPTLRISYFYDTESSGLIEIRATTTGTDADFGDANDVTAITAHVTQSSCVP